ncbi:HAMP domain-containing histidine kinase [Xanthobacter dioxanivorans]|uniref:histidine kinase n=1 Tax=Xanthobacter dioxanivorans TaxID=2528964 RepID=A0A974PTL4_9HYPH|nr:HAMP domain-containing sensor histidine kinase [Xanthobacter dioxanivorans]QRG09246.1 HAMP domain-containing histidine kinase [Xanthobacter dioxanivorans]
MLEPTSHRAGARPAPEGARWRFGLSAKLLALTVVVVAAAEIAVLVPTIANYRIAWLSDRLAAARTAALALDAAPQEGISADLTRELLDSVGATVIVVKSEDTRRLLAASTMPPEANVHIDMRGTTLWSAVRDACDTLMARNGRILRVVGDPPRGADFIEIVLSETPMRRALLRFAATVLLVSLAVAVVAGILVYVSLNWLFVRPMRRLTERISAFRENPEDASRIIVPSGRSDEIGTAEEALEEMQRELSLTLHQKSHLAALGLAVSKINHDLRNLLASAQLLSDRLVSVPDPTVQRFAPKLLAALDRAIAYCEQTLSYGRAKEPLPERRDVEVAQLFEEVRDTLGLASGAGIGWVADVERGLVADADPDQLFRVMLNIARNAVQALEGRVPLDPDRDQIRIRARRKGTVVEIELSDTGPGIPPARREHLFEAFVSSARRGGTGLGLPIAEELVRAHGGEIRLVDTQVGTTFRITIPDQSGDRHHRRERIRA